jgi:curved DNA-binding protein CbpA
MADIEGRNYYELLGLEPGATTDAIKDAYREIARIYHPDSNFYDDIVTDTGPEDSEIFKVITAAYQVLVHEDKRRAYDETLPKGLDSWQDEGDGSRWRASNEQHSDDDEGQEDIPEEWKRERQFFQQNYEEILRPGPRADLTSGDGSTVLAGGVDGEVFKTWGDGESPQPSTLFGSPGASVEEPMFDAIPATRRPMGNPMKDPVQLITYIGLPVMTLVVILELLFLR